MADTINAPPVTAAVIDAAFTLGHFIKRPFPSRLMSFSCEMVIVLYAKEAICNHKECPQGMPAQGMPQQGMPMNSDKDWMTTLLLAILVGGLGVDRFYAGSIGLGILKLFTLGGCGLWALIDIIMIVTESYKDGNGLVIKKQ